MRILASFFICILLLVSCNSLKNNKITVTGTALDAKAGAVVAAEAGRHYYIDGLSEWEKAYSGRKVTVTGYLKTIEHKQKSTTEIKVQEMVGTQLIILHPEWKLAE